MIEDLTSFVSRLVDLFPATEDNYSIKSTLYDCSVWLLILQVYEAEE